MDDMSFFEVVLATSAGVLLAATAVVAVVVTLALLFDLTVLTFRGLHGLGVWIMNRITGMDNHSKKSPEEAEREDWWRNA